MVRTLDSEKIPIKLWLDDMEDGALQQAKNLANLPFAFHHIAIMPDAHFGFGMPIGGILAADGVIVPNAVGVDIGCGMCAVKTSLSAIDEGHLKRVMRTIRQTVPLGFRHHKKPRSHDSMPKTETGSIDDLPIVRSEYDHARAQVGTLGGGNHFIEIQRGSDGRHLVHDPFRKPQSGFSGCQPLQQARRQSEQTLENLHSCLLATCPSAHG